MKKISYFFITAILFFLTGCASAPIASIEKDAGAKNFTPQPSKSSLYIYRNENFGGAIPMDVTINGKTVGNTAAKTYFHFNVDPGEYKIESHAENLSTLSLPIQVGRNYFVWQEVKMGVWKARSNLQQTDETAGRAGVIESKLIATLLSDSELKPMSSSIPNDSNFTAAERESTTTRLRKLKELKEKDIISEEEFNQKKIQLLKEF